ncbi:hypothetical protein [Plantactinospora sp. CA-290183]|uniref:hypothetical protein n=1 Tax=Plantactinospora sp. CA-290183 TaxID=3240006 RepID=UPI003D8FFD40
MDHRDRGRGELARHERHDSDAWGGHPNPWPREDPYSRPDETYRTPSRRRARERGAPEPADSYLPPWALGSPAPADPADAGAESPRGRRGGRHHRVEATGEDPPGPRTDPPWQSSDSRWQETTGAEGWRRRTGAGEPASPVPADPGRDLTASTGGWRRGTAPDEESDPGRDRPRGGGGRRRADAEEPGPAVPGPGRDLGEPAGRWSQRSAEGWRPAGDDGSPGPTGAAGGAVTGAGPGRAGADPGPGGRDGWERDEPGRWDRPAGRRTRSRDRFGDTAGRSGTGAERPLPPLPTSTGAPPWPEPTSSAGPIPWVEPTSTGATPWPEPTSSAGPIPWVEPTSTGATPWPEPTSSAGPTWTEPTSSAGTTPVARSGAADPSREQRSGRAAARWVRSPEELGGEKGRAGRHADDGGTAPERRGVPGRRRAPDAEPVRRQDDTGPVRRYGDDRPGGRHSEASPGRRRADTGRRGGTADTGQWDRFTDTGTLGRISGNDPLDERREAGRAEPVSGTGPWGGMTDTGQWDRFTDTTEWRRDELVGPEPPGATERGGAGWSGARLAGDDPRWTATPASAPRSPAVSYPASPRSAPPARSGGRRAAVPRQRTGTGAGWERSGASSATARGGGLDTAPRRRPTGRPASGTARRPSPLSRRLEDDLLDSRPSGPLSAVLYAAAWYAVPALLFLVWVLTLDASVPVDCVPELTGGVCRSDRGQAVAALVNAIPRFVAALTASLVLAVLLRWWNDAWRAVTIGLAAAVVGGGLTTVLFSVISGQPLG